MIYVIRLIKRLSARNVRAYTGRANSRAGTGNGLCGSAHNGSARGSNAGTRSSTGCSILFFFASFAHRAATRRRNTTGLCSRLITLVVFEMPNPCRHAAETREIPGDALARESRASFDDLSRRFLRRQDAKLVREKVLVGRLSALRNPRDQRGRNAIAYDARYIVNLLIVLSISGYARATCKRIKRIHNAGRLLWSLKEMLK